MTIFEKNLIEADDGFQLDMFSGTEDKDLTYLTREMLPKARLFSITNDKYVKFYGMGDYVNIFEDDTIEGCINDHIFSSYTYEDAIFKNKFNIRLPEWMRRKAEIMFRRAQ